MYEYNPQTGQWEDPEERRKREEEQAKSLGNTEVGKKEIVTYADGSQTHKTTQEIPNPGFFDRLGSAFQQAGNNFVNTLQNAPQNFVNSVGNLGQQQPRPQPQPQPTQQPFAAMPIAPEMPPVDYSMATQQGGPGLRYGSAFAPQQAQQQPQQPVAQPAVPGQPQTQPQPYDARAAAVAQRESGGNFDIGYHFPADEQGRRKSTAYGGFGITAPAYQDIQRANPYFANRPITSLNAQEQRQAFDTLSNLNAQRLQRAGVEATPQNLDLAHFFGANGAANYLKNGYISPQAAGANGGADKVRAVADKILSGGQVAVSGAAESAQPAQPAVTPVQAGITAYQTVQDDPMALLQLRNDTNAPEFIRQRSANRAYELMDAEVKKQQAQSQMGNLTPQEMSRVLTKRSEGNTVGDWLQYLLFKHVGLTDLANEKGEQLGIGSKWQGAVDAKGNAGMIKYTASGMPLTGVKADGSDMTKTELAAYASQGMGKWQTGAEYFQDKAGNIYQGQHNERGQSRIINTQTNEPYTGKETLQRLRDVAGLNKLDQAQTYRRENFKTQLTNQLNKATFENRLGIFKQYNAALVGEGLPPLSMDEMGLTPVGKFVNEAQAAPSATTAPAPAAAANAPTAPGQPVSAPAAAPVGTQRPTMGQIQTAQEQAKAEASATGKKLSEIKTNLPQNESNADQTLAIVNKVITGPGFDKVVGYPTTITNITSLLPSSDARAWQQDYAQLKGKQFMSAYQGLRGTGAISEKEGARAETAIAALNDPGISPADFKRNAETFMEIVKDGINNQRRQAGFAPKYPDTQNEKARAWVETNPNDPRTPAIKQRLGIK